MSETSAPLEIDPDRLSEIPCDQSYRVSREDQIELQRAGIVQRFNDVVERIPLLRKLADEERVRSVEAIEDIGPLLMPHSAYKSYPLSFLEKGRFDLLTSWLDALTVFDLSALETRGCDSIDDWIDILDASTPLRVIHSTGTSGKLSFVPRSVDEIRRQVVTYLRFFDKFGDEPQVLGGTPFKDTYVFFPQYRKGAMTQHRMLDGFQEHVWGGDDSHIVTLNPSRFSADVASIGGRLQAAEAKGASNRITLPPKLLARREAFIAEQQKTEVYVERALETLNSRLRGSKGTIIGHPGMMYDLAVKGMARGMRRIFSRDSFAMIGGGNKGRTLPANWPEVVKEFLGVDRLRSGYGMTEMVRTADRDCPQGNYHLPSSTVPFVVDPANGIQLLRTGVQTGRFGFFDLLATHYWGGFLTGDEVTINWGDKQPCGCRRVGAYLYPSIRRYSEHEAGADDKITCAGAPEAHDKAVEFLIRSGI